MRFIQRIAGICLLLSIAVCTAAAQDQISYTSQPDEVAIFLNDIAFARDTITLPGDVSVRVVLPPQIYQNTLIAYENGERIPYYRIAWENSQPILEWTSSSDTDVLEVTLEYLVAGIRWSPKYDMWLGDESAETVDFDFFAEITNSGLRLTGVQTKLINGRVDTSQSLSDVSTVTANQYIAGYEQSSGGAQITGQASIQHVYDIAPLTAKSGDTIYLSLSENTLPARRLLLWNAQTDAQVTVIYKVRNEAEIPFAEGIVRTYQNDLFVGSDFIELTPVSSEGSVTVGKLQNVRVNRTETRTALEGISKRDTQHDVTLTVSNFDENTIQLDVVDRFPPDALDFQFSSEPSREGDNILRWTITIEPGETQTITYQFKD